jgi:hypothetical protein
MNRNPLKFAFAILATIGSQLCNSAEPVTLENVVAPKANKIDEPLAEKFSIAQAIKMVSCVD